MGCDLHVLSWSRSGGFCLEAPQAPPARLGGSTEALCYQPDCTACSTGASLDLNWSKKMANYPRGYSSLYTWGLLLDVKFLHAFFCFSVTALTHCPCNVKSGWTVVTVHLESEHVSTERTLTHLVQPIVLWLRKPRPKKGHDLPASYSQEETR